MSFNQLLLLLRCVWQITVFKQRYFFSFIHDSTSVTRKKLPKASKSGPKSNKSPNLVTLDSSWLTVQRLV